MSTPQQLSMNDSELFRRRQHHQPPLPPLPGGDGDRGGEEDGDYAHLDPPQHTVTTTRLSEIRRGPAGLPPAGPSAVAARKYDPRTGWTGRVGMGAGRDGMGWDGTGRDGIGH